MRLCVRAGLRVCVCLPAQQWSHQLPQLVQDKSTHTLPTCAPLCACICVCVRARMIVRLRVLKCVRCARLFVGAHGWVRVCVCVCVSVCVCASTRARARRTDPVHLRPQCLVQLLAAYAGRASAALRRVRRHAR